MTRLSLLLGLGLLSAFAACKNTGKDKAGLPGIAARSVLDAHLQNQKREAEKDSLQSLAAHEENRKDSLRLAKVLEEALDIARQNIKEDSFTKEYEQTIEDSLYNVITKLTIGPLFSETQRHLIIRRLTSYPYEAFFDVYLIDGGSFKPVISLYEYETLEYGDTIRDINGDGLKDFSVQSYSASGCCRRHVHKVYLNLGGNGLFTKSYRFINPTFFPNEKIVRGVKYGHPGEVPLYKFRWNGLNVDTLEYIHPHLTANIRRRHYIRTKSRYLSDGGKQEKLKSLPKEYHSIDGLDWFDNYRK